MLTLQITKTSPCASRNKFTNMLIIIVYSKVRPCRLVTLFWHHAQIIITMTTTMMTPLLKICTNRLNHTHYLHCNRSDY